MAIVGGAIGLDYHERPELADRLELVRQDGLTAAQAANALVLILNVLILLVGGSVLLARLHALLLGLPLAGLGSFLAARQAHALERAAREASAEEDRLARHLFDIGTSPTAAPEVRLLGLGPASFERPS